MLPPALLQVHGDVFRPPIFPSWLAVFAGTGVQLFSMTVTTMIFALLGEFASHLATQQQLACAWRTRWQELTAASACAAAVPKQGRHGVCQPASTECAAPSIPTDIESFAERSCKEPCGV